MASLFSERLRANPDYLAYQQAIPQNGDDDGNIGPVQVGNGQARLEIVTEIQSAIDLTDTKELEIALLSSPTETGSYTQIRLFTLTAAAGSGIVAAGVVLDRYIWVPEVDAMWCKVNFWTDDVDVVGAFDTYIRMIVG